MSSAFLLLTVVFGIGGTAAAGSQDATPASTEPIVVPNIQITNVDGETVGWAGLRTVDGGVEISVFVDKLEPGNYGMHIHETGVCDGSGGEPYSSAGGHFNPTGASHGPGPVAGATPASAGSHAGDLGNIEVPSDGPGIFFVVTSWISLSPNAENSLDDADGSALIVHENADDLKTDPSGNSGARIACAVIFPPEAPSATPSG